MRVYVKKEDKQPMLPGVIVTIVFLSFSILVFSAFFRSDESFIAVLASLGDLLLFAIVFFAFSVYFVFHLFKRPKGYKAKLICKYIENYKGKRITYMCFQTLKETSVYEEDSIPSKYNCYTIGENNLTVDNEYSLRLKEFNWEPRYVEDLKNNITNKVPKMTMVPIYFSIIFIFVGMIVFCILGLFFYP